MCNFGTLSNYRNNNVVEQSYYEAKLKLEEYYDHITQSIVLRSKTQCHEFGEKNNKYFLIVEKQNKLKSTIRKLNYNGKTVTQPTDIMASIKDYFCKKYERKICVSPKQYDEFFKNIKTPSQTKVEINNVLGQMDNNKSPGNDGLPKEFFVLFINSISDILIDCYHQSLMEGNMTASQRQAIITLMENLVKIIH